MRIENEGQNTEAIQREGDEGRQECIDANRLREELRRGLNLQVLRPASGTGI